LPRSGSFFGDDAGVAYVSFREMGSAKRIGGCGLTLKSLRHDGNKYNAGLEIEPGAREYDKHRDHHDDDRQEDQVAHESKKPLNPVHEVGPIGARVLPCVANLTRST